MSPKITENGLKKGLKESKRSPKSTSNQTVGQKSESFLNSPQVAMTPQEISEKQKEMMKKLPQHPYKKNVKQKHQPSDVIFEEPGS